MRVLNDGISAFDPSGAQAPWQWYGLGVPVAGGLFFDAPLMSMYWDVTSGSQALYIRTAQNMATADWVKMAYAGGSITGNLTVSGTLTAGDIVATNA